MKFKKVKALVIGLSVFMMGSMTCFAEDLVINQDTNLSENPAAVTVLANVGGQYTVTIPKELWLTQQEDGSYQANYDVDVEGIIASNSYLSVVPQGEINLSTEGKDDVVVSVIQTNQTWRSADYAGDLQTGWVKIVNGESSPEASGNLKVKDGYTLTSGNWQGTLLFDISLNWDAVSGTVSGGEVGEVE